MFPTSLIPESDQWRKVADVVGEYGTPLGSSEDKQRFVVDSTLPCVIEVDNVIAPLRKCLT